MQLKKWKKFDNIKKYLIEKTELFWEIRFK